MPDISELMLKVNKSQAVNDLKGVQKELENTGKAAEGLLDTLKNIGISVGFGKLVQESMQLKNELSAIGTRFNDIFKTSITNNEFSKIKDELGLSESSAKKLLSTIGQFARATGQSSNNIKSISTDLAKASMDFAAYMGKTSSKEIEEIGKKFGKATLGETGELKEMGIIVDAQSEAFKNWTKEVMNATGASEAQAKQLIITQQIMDQIAFSSGESAKLMFDGWFQLNKLMDNFDEILANVGEIFSTVFGPGLNVLNEFLELPFVKSTTAWVIAITAVSAGYISLTNILKSVNENLAETIRKSSLTPDRIKELEDISKRWSKETQRVRKEYQRIYKLAKQIPGFKKPGGKEEYSELNAKEKKQFAVELSTISPSLSNELGNVQSGFDNLKEQLVNTHIVVEDLASLGLTNLNANMLNYMLTSQQLNTVLKSTTAVTLGAAAAQKVLTVANQSLGASFTTLFGIFPKLWAGIKSFFTTLASGAAGFAAFKAVGGALLTVLAKVVAMIGVVIIAFDTINGLINLIKGKEFLSGSLSQSIADWLYSQFSGFDGKERDDYVNNIRKNLRSFSTALKDFEKELADLGFEKTLKQFLPEDAIAALQQKLYQTEKEFKNLGKELTKAKDDLRKAQRNATAAASEGVSEDVRKHAATRLKEAQENFERVSKAYTSNIRERGNLDEQIATKQKELANLNRNYIKEIDRLTHQFSTSLNEISYGYDEKGNFKNMQDEQNAQYRKASIISLTNEINNILSKSTDLSSLERAKELQQEVFNLTKEQTKYELDMLNKQRESLINSKKAMLDFVKSTLGFKQTGQTAIEANSMEALKLQSRTLQKDQQYKPIVEQQKQIKEIEQQMLQKQSTSVTKLDDINKSLVTLTNKIGKLQGVGGSTLETVNPF